MNYMQLLVSKFNEPGIFVSWEELYKDSGTKMEFDDFLRDMDSYLRKKVKSFINNGDGLIINRFCSHPTREMLKYFKFGTDVKDVSVSLLYDNWDERDTQPKSELEKDLEKELANSTLAFFIFQDYLHITHKAK